MLYMKKAWMLSSTKMVATEPGFAGDSGAIEIWLIDWSEGTFSAWEHAREVE